MDTEYQKYLEELKARVKAARLWANFTSLVGFAAIPLTIIFIIANKQSLALASLCWFTGHFIGYLAKCAQQEMVESEQKVGMTESAIKLAKHAASSSHHRGNFHNRIGLN